MAGTKVFFLQRVTRPVLKRCIEVAKRQAASRYLKELVQVGVLQEMQVGKEKLFIHPKLMQILIRDSNEFKPYN